MGWLSFCWLCRVLDSSVVGRVKNGSSSADHLRGVFRGFKNGIPISRRRPSTLKSTCCHVWLAVDLVEDTCVTLLAGDVGIVVDIGILLFL